MRSRSAKEGAMPFGYCTLRKRFRLHLKYAQRQLQLLLQLQLSPVERAVTAMPEADKVRRLSERSAA